MLMIKRTFRWVIIALLVILAICAIAAAVIRFVLLPNIDHYKNDIAAKATEKIGLKTTIGDIKTDWNILSPSILISAINIVDQDNQPALHLENVKGTLSWLSIPMLELHLSDIAVSNPTLTIHRKEDGQIYVAGIAMGGDGKPDAANWLLSQSQFSITNANIVWQDDLRQAPALSLNNVNLNIQNPAWRKLFGQHTFKLDALPSTGTSQSIHLNGYFVGKDVSRIKAWYIKANLTTPDIDLAAWKPWFDYPIDLQSGSGKTDVSLIFSGNQFNKVEANIAIHDLSAKLDADRKLFKADQLSGVLSWEQKQEQTVVSGKDIQLKSNNGLNIDHGNGFVTYAQKNGKPWLDGSITLNSFDLASLNTLQSVIKMPDNIREPLTALSPKGQLSKIAVSVKGNPQSPSHFQVYSSFSNVSTNAYNKIPGLSNISGEIEGNEERGTLKLASKAVMLDFKNVLRWPVPANTLSGKVLWRKNNQQLNITAKDILIASDHINGSLNASYDMNGVKGGYLDLNGKFKNGNATFAPFYYPSVIGEQTISWLDSAIVSGTANNVQLTVKGHLKDFPYIDKENKPNPKLGIFKVSARIDDAVLAYGQSWPTIQGLGLNMLFEGNSMLLEADKGTISGINIVQAKAVIPKLNTHGTKAPVLSITGKTVGPVANGINFINNSPVKDVCLGFTDDLQTAGTGNLNISLKLPLSKIKESTFEGAYAVQNGVIQANARMGIPEISSINGTLNFDVLGIHANTIHGTLLGGPATFDIKTDEFKSINIVAKGNATGAGMKQFMPNIVTESMSGNANWRANIAIKKPLMHITVESDLNGMSLDLPAPFGKTSNQTANFTAKKSQTNAMQDRLDITYNDMASAIITRREHNGSFTFDRADVAINVPAVEPTQAGLSLHGQLDYLNADEWLALSKQANHQSTSANDSSFPLNLTGFSIQQLDIIGRSLNNLSITSLPPSELASNDGLAISLTSQEIDGDVVWKGPSKLNDHGRIIAKLTKLHIPASHDGSAVEPLNQKLKRLHKKYPALDIQADDFKLGKKALGSLALNAFEMNDDWVIESLSIHSNDNVLLADGSWQNWSRSPNTNLNFSLSSSDVGLTLGRFGQPDAIKGGVALIAGKLQWPGSPHQFKKNGLNGTFTLGASKGQILKVKHGVGRLLGLVTLQSLPRRLTLDFRDIFSEGFAFDEISGTAKINDGILHSDDFFMTGPAAEAEIKGKINLIAETQDLNVKVAPHISDTLSLAALAGGPVAGVAAFITQKILKDPLNKIAQSQYTVTGTWDNPVEADAKTEVVEKEPVNSPLNTQ